MLKASVSNQELNDWAEKSDSLAEDSTLLKPYLNKVLHGECVEILKQLPSKCCNVIFADPPYNLQLSKPLMRPNKTKVNGVSHEWDKFASFQDYDHFAKEWLTECRRVLKDDGTLWVMGSYHNIYRLGSVLQDLGFWILNDIIWAKTNPMPNFRGVRFTNAQETLIWASKYKGGKYFFNYAGMKAFNNDVQMSSMWHIPLCTGKERLKTQEGKTLHPTQKPLALLYRALLASTRPGDVVLDPFLGSGTTAVAAKMLNRHYIGIEQDRTFVEAAQTRLNNTQAQKPLEPLKRFVHKRVGLGNLLECGLIKAGVYLVNKAYGCTAQIATDGRVLYEGRFTTMNKLANVLSKGTLGAWDFWSLQEESQCTPLSSLREIYLASLSTSE